MSPHDVALTTAHAHPLFTSTLRQAVDAAAGQRASKREVVLGPAILIVLCCCILTVTPFTEEQLLRATNFIRQEKTG
ncbi:hypothetical protein XELAEV_180095222mg, partial [Xenopus laevis]